MSSVLRTLKLSDWIGGIAFFSYMCVMVFGVGLTR